MGARLRIGGRRYALAGYHANRMATRTEAHERHMLAPLARLLARYPGVFWDVGANVGQTLIKLLSLDPARGYVGFEPQLECAFILDDFIARNGLTHARILPVALGDAAGVTTLYAGSATDEMASTKPGYAGAQPVTPKSVPVLRGDDVQAVLGTGPVGIIKIDVEGAELDVLRGLAGVIARDRPAIVFEVLPNYEGFDRIPLPADHAARRRASATAIREFLTARGYRLFQITPDGTQAPITDFDLDMPERFVSSDYLAEPPA